MTLIKRRQILLGLGAGTALVGCGPLSSGVRLNLSPPNQRDADELARRTVEDRNGGGARFSALFHTHLARGTCFAEACRTVSGVGHLLDGMGLELEREIEAVYVTSSGLGSEHDDETILVFEHSMAPTRAREAFESAVVASGVASKISAAGVRHAQLPVGNAERIVALAADHLIVVLPNEADTSVDRFAQSGGLPAPLAYEALRVDVRGPYFSIAGDQAPDGMLGATLFVSLASGAARIALVARTETDADATRLAPWLEEHVNDALAIDFATLQLSVFGPYAFEARGNEVHSRASFSTDDVRWLVGMGRRMQPGG